MLLGAHNINYWAVLIAAVISMGLGAVWYSPLLFGKTWAKLIGKKMDDMRANAGPAYTVTTIAALVQAFLLANVVKDTNVTTFGNGLLLGLILWVGFVAASTVSDTVFAGRPWKLWKLNTGYYLVVLLVNSAVLAVWR